jgi:hypothetical protein
MTAVAFSGSAELEDFHYLYIAKCAGPHVRRDSNNHFITGAANGVDTLMGYLAYAWRREAYHTVVVPAAAHNADFVSFAVAMDLNVVEMPEGTDYMARNSELIKRADVLVAFPLDEHEVMRGGASAGTWATIRRARKKGIPIHIYPLNKAKPWKENV